jgi:hypothetical protein
MAVFPPRDDVPRPTLLPAAQAKAQAEQVFQHATEEVDRLTAQLHDAQTVRDMAHASLVAWEQTQEQPETVPMDRP